MVNRLARALLTTCILIPSGAAAQEPRAAIIVSVSDAATGEFLPNAIAAIVGTRHAVRTDSSGLARIQGVETGTYMLRVRAIGYTQFNATVIVATDSAEIAVQLRPAVPTLARVTVTDSFVSPWLREFEERRKRGTGRYVTRADIRNAHGSDLGTLLMQKIPSVRVRDDGVVFSLRGPNSFRGTHCLVVVYIDGIRSGNAEEFALPLLGGIEYYTPSTVPVQYRGAVGTVGCGVLLIWTGP